MASAIVGTPTRRQITVACVIAGAVAVAGTLMVLAYGKVSAKLACHPVKISDDVYRRLPLSAQNTPSQCGHIIVAHPQMLETLVAIAIVAAAVFVLTSASYLMFMVYHAWRIRRPGFAGFRHLIMPNWTYQVLFGSFWTSAFAALFAYIILNP